jgi:hypothetical protein
VKLALLGYGGHAREVMFQMSKELPCFVSDDFVWGNTLPLSKFDPKQYKLMVAVGDSKTRKYLVDNFTPINPIFYIYPPNCYCK